MGGQERGRGGVGDPGGLTAKSSKLLAQYSSCSKLPQVAEALAARLARAGAPQDLSRARVG